MMESSAVRCPPSDVHMVADDDVTERSPPRHSTLRHGACHITCRCTEDANTNTSAHRQVRRSGEDLLLLPQRNQGVHRIVQARYGHHSMPPQLSWCASS